MRKVLLNPFSMLIVGLALGAVSRLFDLYTQNLGNIFLQMAIWILFGVLISIYSSAPKKAMLNVFPFCIGMLITYYFAAFMTDGVYSNTIVLGWTVFALCSPVLAYFYLVHQRKGALAQNHKHGNCGGIFTNQYYFL